MTALHPAEPTRPMPAMAGQPGPPLDSGYTDHGYIPEEHPDGEYIHDELPRRPVRKRMGAASLLLCGTVIAAAAFYGGVLTEKHSAKSTVTASGGTGAALRAGAGGGAAAAGGGAGAAAGAGTGRAGATGGGGGAAGRAGGAAATGAATGTGSGGALAGATFGQIKLIDGANIYVTDQTGNIVKVATTPQSQITLTTTGTARDVKPGDTVVVTGPTGADGTVDATAVRDQGAGVAGLGGGGFGAGGGVRGTGGNG